MAAGPDVVVLDYGSGNLRSATRALEAAGARVELTADLGRARDCDGLVVPGVGAFATCMEGLQSAGGDRVIAERAAAGRPVLAICVGFQILFSRGVEHGLDTAGCGLWPGTVESLRSARLPHMGWNTVEPGEGSRLFAGVEDERFYFVHSYGVHTTPDVDGAVCTWAEHGGDRFLAAVEAGSVAATQFHPEKSGPAGIRLLHDWVSRLG